MLMQTRSTLKILAIFTLVGLPACAMKFSGELLNPLNKSDREETTKSVPAAHPAQPAPVAVPAQPTPVPTPTPTPAPTVQKITVTDMPTPTPEVTR